MGGNRRANKAPRGNVSRTETTPWFDANVKRQKNRNKIAKASRRKNRPKK